MTVTTTPNAPLPSPCNSTVYNLPLTVGRDIYKSPFHRPSSASVAQSLHAPYQALLTQLLVAVAGGVGDSSARLDGAAVIVEVIVFVMRMTLVVLVGVGSLQPNQPGVWQVKEDVFVACPVCVSEGCPGAVLGGAEVM